MDWRCQYQPSCLAHLSVCPFDRQTSVSPIPKKRAFPTADLKVSGMVGRNDIIGDLRKFNDIIMISLIMISLIMISCFCPKK